MATNGILSFVYHRHLEPTAMVMGCDELSWSDSFAKCFEFQILDSEFIKEV